MSFKPWGDLESILLKFDIQEWRYLGCLSTEQRCTAGIVKLCELRKVTHALFFNITDPITTPTHEKFVKSNSIIIEKLDCGVLIENHTLLEPLNIITNSLENFLPSNDYNLIVDISTLPKRFFFPIIKFLTKRYQARIKNLLVLHTSPEEYAENDLSTDPTPWAHIPTFDYSDTESEVEVAIIGLGFMPFNLPDLLKDEFTSADRRFLFPFPPGPPFYQRTWSFLESINHAREIRSQEIKYIDSGNVADTFDQIFNICNKGRRNALLAPYGPKTVSLAMCLYACSYPAAVYYTQPTSYNPEYSKGIKDTMLYSIIINHQNLYT
ncbi:hypothetical protein [Cesiribacter sp. SM1]|uniref:hypothetical protein n=1 Tax=Cesiribacter sp. SM1 TaxID=2861196 RepID=UPI001CD1DC50|nr:hypothetical protein [Cesiribacter sp. SM1]